MSLAILCSFRFYGLTHLPADFSGDGGHGVIVQSVIYNLRRIRKKNAGKWRFHGWQGQVRVMQTG